jgi:DnaJ-class molecular chaperone
MADNDYYSILGVSRTATADEVKSAYRGLVRKHHPDIDKSDGAEDRFKKINQAYEVLSDPEKRKIYDQFGSAAFDGNAAGANPGGQGPFGGFGNGGYSYTWSSGSEGFGDFDPFDVLNSMFGGGFGGKARPKKPTYQIQITFDEAVKGVEKEVALEGNVKKKIKIPAGVDDGTTVRFDDFNLVLRVAPSKIFQRDGYDIILDYELPLTTAILGGEVDVPTLNDSIKLKIQAGTQPDTTIRLRGYGVQSPRSGGKGDQYVRYKLRVPTKLSGKAKKLIEELAREL